MAQLAARLAGLSPERRRLLARLLESQSGGSAGARGQAAATAHEGQSALTPEKQECRRLYDGINQQLDASLFGPFSFFLNLGYAPAGEPSESVVELPDHVLNRNSVRLVLELIGPCDLKARRVLDVGCGRGGTVSVMAQYFEPATVCGVDLSPAAIAFCRGAHHYSQVRFDVGDAERLDLPDGSVDVVVNVESSSTYPDVFKFYGEVFRVLAPGGLFLYTDALPVTRFAECGERLQRGGFAQERDRDITPNVLKSCDEVAQSRVQAYGVAAGGALDDFLGTPGSYFYDAMKRGEWTYRIQRWRKTAAA